MRQNSLVAQLPDPPPEAVRVVGILLVVQGLLRLAFLTMLILQGGIDEINIYVVAAALIGAGGVAAGVLALQRFAVARIRLRLLCDLSALSGLYPRLHSLQRV